jgi:hypothetical protein
MRNLLSQGLIMQYSILWFIIFQCCVVFPLSIRFDPMKLISDGINYNEMSYIMLALLNNKHYAALLGFLKHPFYDFGEYYYEACESLSISMVMDVVESELAYEDQCVILSEKCIYRASGLLKKLRASNINFLPVNPMCHDEFTPLQVSPEVYKNFYASAVKSSSDPKQKPVNFYNWLHLKNFNPSWYFNLQTIVNPICSTLNGIMFQEASELQKFWIMSILKEKLWRIELDSVSFEAINVLKLMISLDSIHQTLQNDDEMSPLLDQCKGYLSSLIKYCEKQNDTGTDRFTINVIRTICNWSESTMASLIDLIEQSGVLFHSDLLVGVFTLDISSDRADQIRLLKIIAAQNPHIKTIQVLAGIKHLSMFWSQFAEIFGEELILQLPEFESRRSLSEKFKALRSKLLPFPRLQRLEFIPGLIDFQREPKELFRDACVDFYENLCGYSNSLTSVVVQSGQRNGKIKNVIFLDFISKFFESFLKLPEFYIITNDNSKDSVIELIPSPLLSSECVHVIIVFIVHYSLAGRIAPFKINRKYLQACLKLDEVEINSVFLNNIKHIRLEFLLISQVVAFKSHYTSSNYFLFIIEKYNEIVEYRDENSKSESLQVLSSKEYHWLNSSFLESSKHISFALRRKFPNTFNFDEIYYLLFERINL